MILECYTSYMWDCTDIYFLILLFIDLWRHGISSNGRRGTQTNRARGASERDMVYDLGFSTFID